MFTPPPSPQPSRTDGFHISASILEPSTEELDHLEKIGDSNDIKRRAGRRFLWAVVLIPFILIAFTIFGGFPTSLVRNSTSVFSSPPPLWYGLESHKSIWKKKRTTSSTYRFPIIFYTLNLTYLYKFIVGACSISDLTDRPFLPPDTTDALPSSF